MSISWNGQKLKTIIGQDDLIHTLRLQLTAVQGINVLEIAGEGKSDCLGMTIANVKLSESADLKAEVKTQGRFNFL